MGETTTTMTESHPRASAASSTGMRPGATSCAGRSGGFGRRSWEWDCAAESWLNRGGCTYGTRTTRSYCARAVVCRPCRVPCRGRCNRCAPQRRRACCGRATILHDIQVARQSLIVGGGGLFLGGGRLYAPFTAICFTSFTVKIFPNTDPDPTRHTRPLTHLSADIGVFSSIFGQRAGRNKTVVAPGVGRRRGREARREQHGSCRHGALPRSSTIGRAQCTHRSPRNE